MKNNWQKAEEVLVKDGVVILPTDTLYGIVASVKSKKAVEKIYKIKGRSKNKPLIVLINSYKNLKMFGININKEQAKNFSKFWPGKVSVELSHSSNKFSHLRGGHNYNGFRMIGPKNKNLYDLIDKVGPIVAPSANKQGERPASKIAEAKRYFGNEIDLYIDGGRKESKPSTLIKYQNNKFIILRQGEVKISQV